jgi:hypothetical protein
MEINWLEILIGFAVGLVYSEVKDQIIFFGAKKNFQKNLHDLFYFNLDRCDQMKKQLTEPKNGMIEIPNYPFDTDALKHVIFDGRDFFKDQNSFDDINWRRYQLDHLNLKLAAINSLSTASPERDQLLQGFLLHLIPERKAIEELLGAWNQRI